MSFVLAFMCGWLLAVNFRQQNQLSKLQQQPMVYRAETPALEQPHPLSNAAIAQAANNKAAEIKEQAVTRLFIKEQQQQLQRQVEEFLTLTEPLLLSTNLERQALSNAVSKAEQLHSKIDPNSFNPILEIRFDARRGTLQSLVNQ
ncbi:MAG: hypothetical protein EBU46_00515 [Nitrosomonadaceae bacterium]|nr:hypothetical protein [Nitrosomonadaceae bacterium]